MEFRAFLVCNIQSLAVGELGSTWVCVSEFDISRYAANSFERVCVVGCQGVAELLDMDNTIPIWSRKF